jgi:hypothetical protein
MTPSQSSSYGEFSNKDLEAFLEAATPSAYDRRAIFNELVKRYSQDLREPPRHSQENYDRLQQPAVGPQPVESYNSGIYYQPLTNPPTASPVGRGVGTGASGCLIAVVVVIVLLFLLAII